MLIWLIWSRYLCHDTNWPEPEETKADPVWRSLTRESGLGVSAWETLLKRISCLLGMWRNRKENLFVASFSRQWKKKQKQNTRFLAEEMMHLNPGGWHIWGQQSIHSNRGMKKWYKSLTGAYGAEFETMQKLWQVSEFKDGQLSPGKRARQCVKQGKGKKRYLIYNQVPSSPTLVKLINEFSSYEPQKKMFELNEERPVKLLRD